MLLFLFLLREFDSQCDRALVPENAKLDALRFVAGHQLFAQLAGVVDAFAVQAGDHIAHLQPGFCRN